MTRRRPPSRNAVEDALMRARSHLTTRDWRILELLDEHRVLTALQLCDLAFHHPTTARHRLAVLYRLKVVNRFRSPPERLGGGSAPFHYVLDRYGALLVAQQRAADEHDPLGDDSVYAELGRARRQRQLARLNPDYLLAIATSQRLRHQVEVNAFFCALARAARHSDGDRELVEWQGEKRARRHSAAYERVCVRPDGYGIWAEDGGQLPFFFEPDRGTEALDRLAGKLDGYAQAEEAAQQPTWILVSLPSEQREQHARHAMHRSGVPDVPVATTHRRLPATNHPDQAVWWPLHDPGAHQGRVRLVDLAAVPFPAGSLHRAGAIRRAHAQEAARTAARKAEHQRWLAERQALEEAAARQAELAAQQAQEPARASVTGRWRVFGR